MPLRYLEDYEVGGVVRSPSRLVTKQEIISFASTWDPQPFHTDEEAAKTSIYGGLVASTAHIFAVSCALGAETDDRVAALAGLGFDEMRVHRPLRADDSVYFTAECKEVRRSMTKPDRGIVRTFTTIWNQNDEEVFSLYCTMMVKSRSFEE